MLAVFTSFTPRGGGKLEDLLDWTAFFEAGFLALEDNISKGKPEPMVWLL